MTDNIPGVITEKQDLGLDVLAASSAPIVLVLGTAATANTAVGRSRKNSIILNDRDVLLVCSFAILPIIVCEKSSGSGSGKSF